jgi:hypothetical protein
VEQHQGVEQVQLELRMVVMMVALTVLKELVELLQRQQQPQKTNEHPLLHDDVVMQVIVHGLIQLMITMRRSMRKKTLILIDELPFDIE